MTDMASATDGVFSYLVRNLIPLVVDPLLPTTAEITRLCGVARVGDQRVRVVLNLGVRTTPGVAIEFDLTSGESTLDVEAAIRFCQSLGTARLDHIISSGGALDSHGNTVARATELGFSEKSNDVSQDLALFSLFSLLVHGGGFPWFEDVFTFDGFMLTAPDRCRLYLKTSNTCETFGVEIPLRDSSQLPLAPSTALPHELSSLIRDGELFRRECLDEVDDYCSSVFDLSEWLGVKRHT
jgi:hypothetical protein